MRRREFFRVFGGAAAAWPLAVRAQQASVPIVALICKFARNNDPLRGDFASNSDPS
jgi:hypothetical protein